LAAHFATVMAATLAGIGITLVVTQSWLRWVMVDAALIAFWRSSATPPSAASSRRISGTLNARNRRVAHTVGWFRDLRQIRHTNPSRMSARRS
jgi:hypothetical protein